MLSNRLILQGDCRVSVINKKGANIEMRARVKLSRSVVENAEAAAWDNRRHITAAEAKRIVRPKSRIGQQMRFVTVRINGIDSHVIRENRVIRRERRGDQIVKSDARPHQTPI